MVETQPFDLSVGDHMPSFQAYNEEGDLISSHDIHGSVALIYFYPKDDTPGCTQEACDFRDSMEELDSCGVVVLGISPDSSNSHRNFIERYELNFGLLSDPNLDIAKKFGAVRKSSENIVRTERATYLIDEAGIIQWIEKPVQVEGHVGRVLQAIAELAKR